jgi:hypothetical protein
MAAEAGWSPINASLRRVSIRCSFWTSKLAGSPDTFWAAFPKNPFLLLTTDGGKTWSQKDILSEGGFGTIEHFWFDSRNSGTLILDRTRAEEGRHELYESMTGGESWTLRESSSKPIPFKQEKAGSCPSHASGWSVEILRH